MGKSSKKPKFYAVAKGSKPGIYTTWAECEEQVKGFSGAKFKSFPTRQEAEAYVRQNSGNNNGRRSSSDTATEQAASSKRQKTTIAPTCWISIEIYFDGGARGNPGVAGAGAKVVIDDDSSRSSNTRQIDIRKYLGTQSTNNEAEYTGLICALHEAKNAATEFVQSQSNSVPGIRLSIKGDSDLIIQQMEGTYQVKSKNLQPLYKEAKAIIGQIEALAAHSEISFEHVYRNDNKDADALANEAMDSQRSWKTDTSLRNDGDEKDASDGSSAKNEIILEDV